MHAIMVTVTIKACAHVQHAKGVLQASRGAGAAEARWEAAYLAPMDSTRTKRLTTTQGLAAAVHEGARQATLAAGEAEARLEAVYLAPMDSTRITRALTAAAHAGGVRQASSGADAAEPRRLGGKLCILPLRTVQGQHRV